MPQVRAFEDHLRRLSECSHPEGHHDVGQTMHEGFPALVHWCRDCGAVQTVQTAGAYKSTKWLRPSMGS